MYSGYVLFCSNTTVGACLNKKLYTCAETKKDEVANIQKGSVLFLYNSETRTLVGPFTAASGGAERIETGAWTSKVDEHSASENIKLEWEDLHVINSANERFPFLEKPEKCGLSTLRVQTLLDALKEAPAFKGQE
jgi:Development and cell death domain